MPDLQLVANRRICQFCDEEETRVDIEIIERLCELFRCQIGDLFEYVESAKAGCDAHGGQ